MEATGFFTQLFNQFVALLSAFCIGVPGGPVREVVAVDTGPPGDVAQIDQSLALRQQPLLARVIETQYDAFVSIGRAVAGSADAVTYAVLAIPSDLADTLSEGGIAALPAGIARSGQRFVGAAEDSAINIVSALTQAFAAELALVPGVPPLADRQKVALAADVSPDLIQREPLIVRVVRTQLDGALSIGTAVLGVATGLGAAIIGIPATVAAYVGDGGPAALPAALAVGARQVLVAASDGIVRVIEAVGNLARAELSLIPGATVPQKAELNAQLVERQPTGGILGQAVETAVRLPLAIGVAASDLVVAGMRATTSVTGAAADAATGVVRAAVNPRGKVTLADAIGRVPGTLVNGGLDAAGEIREGFSQAATDFRNTLNPRVRTRVSATGGLNTAVNGNETGTTGVSVAASPSGPSNRNRIDGVADAATLTESATVGSTTTEAGVPGAGSKKVDADSSALSAAH